MHGNRTGSDLFAKRILHMWNNFFGLFIVYMYLKKLQETVYRFVNIINTVYDLNEILIDLAVCYIGTHFLPQIFIIRCFQLISDRRIKDSKKIIL